MFIDYRDVADAFVTNTAKVIRLTPESHALFFNREAELHINGEIIKSQLSVGDLQAIPLDIDYRVGTTPAKLVFCGCCFDVVFIMDCYDTDINVMLNECGDKNEC